MHSAELSEKLARLAGTEAIAESGIGSKGNFPGPLFLAFPPIEIEWPQRFALAGASGANDKIEYGDLVRAAAKPEFRSFYEASKYGVVPDSIAEHFGTQGLADLAHHRLRIGRDRDPARARSDPARRMRRGARDRRRRLDHRGIGRALLAPLGALHQQRFAAGRVAPVLEKSRRLRAGGRRGARSCWKITITRSRAAPKFSPSSKAAARRRTISTAPARAPTASR